MAFAQRPLGHPPGLIIDPQSLNRYSYAANDSVNLVDPHGLDPITIIYVDVWAPFWLGGFGGGGAGGIGHYAPLQDTPEPGGRGGGGFFARLGKRLACAAQFGDAHSLAAATGTQNSFLGKAFLGNTFSGITQVGLLFAGGPSEANAKDLGVAVLAGTHQGLPGGGNIGKGPIGVAQDAIVGAAATAGYNAVVGAGTQTLELGVNASGKVATAIGGLSETAAGTVAGVVAGVKVVGDLAVFAYGGVFRCK